MKHAIIVDLDGTIANNTHRQHFITGDNKKKDFKSFNAAHMGDIANEWCVDLMVAMMSAKYTLIIVSGRSDDYRESTMRWLEDHCVPYDLLYMRPSEDYRPDWEVKLDIYENIIKPEFNILFCVDDRKQVVDMWRRIGLTCLQCAEGNF